MIRKRSSHLIESDEGFSLLVLGRTGLRYVEGERSVAIDSEGLMGRTGMIVYPASIKTWDRPFDEEQITDEKRRQILDRVHPRGCHAIFCRTPANRPGGSDPARLALASWHAPWPDMGRDRARLAPRRAARPVFRVSLLAPGNVRAQTAPGGWGQPVR